MKTGKLTKRNSDIPEAPGLCVVGLGNRGMDGTRHNIGFQFVDELADILDIPFKKRIFEPYLYAKAAPGGRLFKQIILVKPLTNMNRSGAVIPFLLRNYGTDTRFVIVVDNMDLPPGIARLKKQGGTAGHNGLKSVFEYLGKDFWPLYIGVGHPGRKSDVVDYVLGSLNEREQTIYKTCLRVWAEHLLDLLSGDLETVMQQINSSQKDVPV